MQHQHWQRATANRPALTSPRRLPNAVNEEEADAGQVFWDVFKTARLEALKAREPRDSAAAANAKRERVMHTCNLAPKMPKSFTGLSAKEAKMAAYAQVGAWVVCQPGLLGAAAAANINAKRQPSRAGTRNVTPSLPPHDGHPIPRAHPCPLQDFARVFSELYPQRRPLYLLPPNECGVPKLVCSTLRPTQLPHTELYDLPAAAQFVADFIAYEQLEDPAVGCRRAGTQLQAGGVGRAVCQPPRTSPEGVPPTDVSLRTLPRRSTRPATCPRPTRCWAGRRATASIWPPC
jgi:hypothetical protein